MPQVQKHAPGDFCWMELGTTDQAAAKSFYTALFGWTPNDMPLGQDRFYTMFRLDGRDVAAGFGLTAEERGRGIPAHWNLYIAVENADAATGQANKLGAKILEGPFDVSEAGRMAVIEDPTGAIFSIWQPRRNTGVGITGEPGAFCWADLITRNPQRARQFYSELFGWKITVGEGKPVDGYLHIQNGETFIGGIPPGLDAPNSPPHWLVYFQVVDVDAAATKAEGLGARLYVPPTTIEGVGRMAVMADPQGAV